MSSRNKLDPLHGNSSFDFLYMLIPLVRGLAAEAKFYLVCIYCFFD